MFTCGKERRSMLSENCRITGIALRVLLRANTITLYQSTTHIILTFSPTKIYFREVKINQELVQNQQTFQVATLTLLILLKQAAILHTITCSLISPLICGAEQRKVLSGNFRATAMLPALVQVVTICIQHQCTWAVTAGRYILVLLMAA